MSIYGVEIADGRPIRDVSPYPMKKAGELLDDVHDVKKQLKIWLNLQKRDRTIQDI